MSLVQDRSRRAHIDGDTQSQLFRPHLQGTKSCCLLGKTHRGDHSRCPAGTLLIHFPMPFEQLLLEILLVMEASHFEEGRLYEAHKVLHGPFFLRPMRPTQLHPDAHLKHRVGEDWIPFRYLAVSLPLQSHGLRSVEHAQQRNSAPTVKMLGKVTDQALHGFVLHQTDADESGVLQARGEEVDPAGRSVDKFDVHLSEIMLAEFPRQTFEANQGLYSLRTQRGHQSIQGGLASRIARLPNSPKDLQRG